MVHSRVETLETLETSNWEIDNQKSKIGKYGLYSMYSGHYTSSDLAGQQLGAEPPWAEPPVTCRAQLMPQNDVAVLHTPDPSLVRNHWCWRVRGLTS